jgi:flavin-dependent dehydrogenase
VETLSLVTLPRNSVSDLVELSSPSRELSWTKRSLKLPKTPELTSPKTQPSLYHFPAKKFSLTCSQNATFLEDKGLWKVECVNEKDEPRVYYARVLVCADGAPSRLARQLGYVKTEPQGTCSRAYVKDNTLFNADGLIFYPKRLLPGYCAIIREAGNELNFCTYIIPGGEATNDDLPRLHDEIMKYDPYVSKLLGPNPNIERMKSASLRLGGIPKSYDHHLLIIGDAAGFIDPLTGGTYHLPFSILLDFFVL